MATENIIKIGRTIILGFFTFSGNGKQKTLLSYPFGNTKTGPSSFSVFFGAGNLVEVQLPVRLQLFEELEGAV